MRPFKIEYSAITLARLVMGNYLYKFSDISYQDQDHIEQEMILWKKDELINNLNFKYD